MNRCKTAGEQRMTQPRGRPVPTNMKRKRRTRAAGEQQDLKHLKTSAPPKRYQPPATANEFVLTAPPGKTWDEAHAELVADGIAANALLLKDVGAAILPMAAI